MSQTSKALIWRDRSVPVSVAFDDPYYSMDDGLAEARHVFLAGNGLPARFRPGLHIAELGFGTGLNLLAVADLWRAAGAPGKLRYTSFEQFPLSAEEAHRAQEPFEELRDLADLFAPIWRGEPLDLEWIEVSLIIGDARATLPAWQGHADAWFLDGFSPAKNPELWEPALMAEVANHTAPGGTFATYSAASAVRGALEGAGFDVERVQGFGRKKHMTRGTLR
ncbi:MAG: tRNA (5-methylaminomethyl-2-thiouridine)(34)-methyltransferase MnmD [Pseudomonadota bacterium]